MRLRLDKLVLSAGLALAMVATTVPVVPVSAGSTTTSAEETTIYTAGLSNSEGKTVKDDDKLKKAFCETISNTSINTTAKVSDEITSTVTALTFAEVAGATNIAVDAGTTVEARTDGFDDPAVNSGIKPATYTVTQVTTYTVTGFKAQVTSETVTATDLSSDDINAAKALAVKAAKVDDDIAAKDFTYGTYSIDSDDLAGLSITETEMPEDKTLTVGGTFTKTKIYTVTSLPTGYTYDLLMGATYAANKEYKVYKQDKDGAYEKPITSAVVLKAADTKDILVQVTDLAGSYVLASKTVSTKDALLFNDADDTGDATTKKITLGDGTEITIKQDTTKTSDAKLDAKVTEAGLTHVAYLTITSNGSKELGTPVEFKIAIPSGMNVAGRAWKVIRKHTDVNTGNEVVDIIDATVSGNYIVFSTDRFSDYALAYVDGAVETPTEETPATDTTAETPVATEAAATTAEAATTATATTTSPKTADNSMMSLFMTTLLLALCAGSLAIYKEKKTN